MKRADETSAKRARLAPDERRAQLVLLARSAALARGNLPIPLAELAKAAGVSKALVYTYFPTQHDLFNAVLAADFEALAEAGIVQAARSAGLAAAAEACAALYFEHIVARGTIAHLILRDPYMRGQVSAPNRAFRDRVAGSLARAARRELGMRPNVALAAYNLAVTIPEEAGLLVRSGDTERGVGRRLVVELMQSTLAALTADTEFGAAQPAGPR